MQSRVWDTSKTSCKKEQGICCSGSRKLLCLLIYYDWEFHTLGKNNEVNNSVFTQHYLEKIPQWSFLRAKRKISQYGAFYWMSPWVFQVGKNKSTISNMPWSLAPLCLFKYHFYCLSGWGPSSWFADSCLLTVTLYGGKRNGISLHCLHCLIRALIPSWEHHAHDLTLT